MVYAIMTPTIVTQKHPAIKTMQHIGIGWEEHARVAQTNDGVGWMTLIVMIIKLTN